MARKSKYSADPAPTHQWRAALYIRLSREDGDKDESNSVANQRALLQDFIAANGDISVFDIYIDDGWSGTNTNRPSFVRLDEDIRSRKINCIIVKDLSRFARNYAEAGSYFDKTFIFYDIRFISILDQIDSFKNPSSMDSIIVPFKNIINDEYCRDISTKVKSALDTKRRQGKFIGSFALYGYLKDPADRHKLVVDPYAAMVVKDIYAWFIGGMGCISIAKKLNSQRVLNPTAHKKSLGLNYRHTSGAKNDTLWCESTVRRILTNETYTGKLIQGRYGTKSYKMQTNIPRPPEKWFVTENAHEPIIAQDLFDKVQQLFRRDVRTSPKEHKANLFSGFLRCADCDRAMNRKHVSQPYAQYYYYVCSTYKKMNRNACSKHTIRSDQLENAVLVTIQQQIQLAVSMSEVLEAINNRSTINTESMRLNKDLLDKQAEKKRIEQYKLSLYPDWKNGDITKEEYTDLKAQFDAQLRDVCEAIEVLETEIAALSNGVSQDNHFVASFKKHKNVTSLSRELLVELVDHIFVHEGGMITIKFKYEDAFIRAVEFLEANQHDIA